MRRGAGYDRPFYREEPVNHIPEATPEHGAGHDPRAPIAAKCNSRAIRIALGLVIASMSAGCGDPVAACSNQSMAILPAPNALRGAHVFTRDCGPIEGLSTEVSVLEAEVALPDAPGNVFGAEMLVAVSVEWHNDETLVIRHPKDVTIKHAETQIDDIVVAYAAE